MQRAGPHPNGVLKATNLLAAATRVAKAARVRAPAAKAPLWPNPVRPLRPLSQLMLSRSPTLLRPPTARALARWPAFTTWTTHAIKEGKALKQPAVHSPVAPCTLTPTDTRALFGVQPILVATDACARAISDRKPPSTRSVHRTTWSGRA